LHPGHEAHQGRYDEAAGAYCIGDFEAAAAGFSALSRLGCAPAAAYLALMYLRGEGVEKDVETGLGLVRTATEWGCANAAFSLGALHRSGDYGVPRDAMASRSFFLLARELGCEQSVEDFLTSPGHGVTESLEEG
jgi:TPR repeat protein